MTTHSSRRINALARRLRFQNYLEVGVSEGATFRHIEMPNRTGVDPNFLFDPNMLRDAHTNLISETSDSYFAQLEFDRKFDVVFVDGLHTFEQVVRDFSNAVMCTHDRSIILIDDTRPSDVYSSLRDQSETFALRSAFTGAPWGGDWHGDVFKAMFYINDFWPSMNFRTLMTGGNPQSLVWRSRRERHTPIFDSLETISRMTFFDLHKHSDVLREATEEEAIELCVFEITGS